MIPYVVIQSPGEPKRTIRSDKDGTKSNLQYYPRIKHRSCLLICVVWFQFKYKTKQNQQYIRDVTRTTKNYMAANSQMRTQPTNTTTNRHCHHHKSYINPSSHEIETQNRTNLFYRTNESTNNNQTTQSTYDVQLVLTHHNIPPVLYH